MVTPKREQPRRVSNCGENYTNGVPLNVLRSSSTVTYGVKANKTIWPVWVLFFLSCSSNELGKRCVSIFVYMKWF